MTVFLVLLMVAMFLRCMSTCQRDKVGQKVEKIFPILASRALVGIITILKALPLILLAVALGKLCLTSYFEKMKLVLAIGILQLVLTFGFNVFNSYRFFVDEKSSSPKQKYWVLDARYT